MKEPILDIDITLDRDCFQLHVKEQLCLGSIWAIMGASGCGKTSLLRCLAGLESHARGRITFDGVLWQDSATGVMVPAEKRGIGYIFQEARLFPHLDVIGNLDFARKRASQERSVPSFKEVVEQLGIAHLLTRGVEKLSGGEKQRVAIARTLLNAPSILLMDEPLASLDWQSKAEILPLLRHVQRYFNIPVIVVSHAREEVARLADELLLIDAGQIVNRGRCRTMLMSMGTGREPALSVLEGRIIRHDPVHSLTEIHVNDRTLTVNKVNLKPGDNVRVVLPANEISIFLDDIQATSVQNRLSVLVDRIQEQSSHHVLLTLSLGEQKLQSLITRKSMSELSLSVGQKVYAHFKAAGLDVY